jgi:hypothetical protein
MRNWHGSLAVASALSHFEGVLWQIKRSPKSPEADLSVFVPFRVNSWIVLVKSDINTNPSTPGLTRLLPQASCTDHETPDA